jgi:nucleotide-binding universal stress UspA family protein
VKSGQGAEACFRKALVALDLSDATGRLVDWLPNLRLLGVRTILLLHVVPETPLRELAHLIPIHALVEQQRARAVRQLAEYAAKLSAAGFEVEALAPKHGDPAGWIVRTAQLHAVNLIVVGSKGHSMLRRILIGSTAEEVVNLADRPVLIVKLALPHIPAVGEGPILAAVDFDLYLDDIIACSRTLARRVRTDIILLHVLEPGEDRVEVEEKLETLAAQLRREEAAVTVKLVAEGKPAKVVVDYASKTGASLVLVGPGSPTHTHFIGLTGEAIIRRVQTNVIVCRRATVTCNSR